MLKKLFFFVAALAATLTSPAQVSIIPMPAEVNMPQTRGLFTVNKGTAIVYENKMLAHSASFLNSYLKQLYGFQLPTSNTAKKKSIYLSVKKNITQPKGSYQLEINEKGVFLVGNDEAGVFYALQSFLQLLPVDKKQSLALQFVSISDFPRFEYRGMHLDVSRNFFPVSFVKRYIDYLAFHKMNYFHWHLTDDQGWRIEIKKYPKLTAVGGYRDGTIIGHHPGTGNDNRRYGGYYTQQEVKEIVKYAAQRYITVIPEIEMPGHASAAIAAYNFLSCFPEKQTQIPAHPSAGAQQKKGKKVQETWGVFEDIFCAGKDSTFFFLQNVLDEVITMFPSKYIHIGGDEAPKDHWKICPACQARMKNENLKDEHHLQSYFIQRIEKFVNGKGRTIIGWDEILEGGLAPNAVVMSWRGEQGGIEAASQNHFVIMTPGSHVYFDHSQTKKDDSLTFGGYTTVKKVYSYEPIPKELLAGKEKYILGAQANVWTEYIKYPSKVEYQIFPRMSALSEVLWSPKDQRNWANFEPRLTQQYLRYNLWGAHYFSLEKAINQEEK